MFVYHAGMRAQHATEADELKAWVDAVRILPRFLRTPDARALFDALAEVPLHEGATFADVAPRIGRSTEELIAALRKCPFGV